MKLRNFLYLNTKIINDYLSAIDGYVYNEEAQSRDGGLGSIGNGQITHPYCNTGYKN